MLLTVCFLQRLLKQSWRPLCLHSRHFSCRRVTGICRTGKWRTIKKRGVEFAGLENDGRSRRGGICMTGKWRTGKWRTGKWQTENDGLENDGVEQEQTYILHTIKKTLMCTTCNCFKFILDIWLKARSKCYSVCYTELIVEDLHHIVTISTLWQRALSTISFVTVATVHTALITCILPNLSHRVPWGWDRVAMTLNYLLWNLNSINETLLSVLYFNTYDCVYTVLVFSGCVVIFKDFLLRFIVWF